MYSKEELKQLKTEFWESFAAFCEVQPNLRNRKPLWILYDTKIKGVELKFDLSRNNVLVALEINHRAEDERIEMFERIIWHKETLEKGFAKGTIEWKILEELAYGKQVSRIIIAKEGLDFHKRADWGELFRFMSDNMLQLETNFLEIKDFLMD
ncbi:MAG: DUF4268 domain-containing protein [Bacteroidales bacterium]|nr:DUF4268 domain-containing protein [Bacteroidales bacterium]